MKKFILLPGIFLTVFLNNVFSQSCGCDEILTPTYTIDLSSNPDTTWHLSDIVNPLPSRAGDCCQPNIDQENCVKFNVTLSSQATQVSFVKGNGSSNNGTVCINCGADTACGPPTSINCPPASQTFCITYCNPGNNKDDYTISSSKGFFVSEIVSVREGCSGELSATGLTSVTWNSIFPNNPGDYNTRLSSTSGTSVTVVPLPGDPSVIKYEVCGTASGCGSGSAKCDTVTVNITSGLIAAISPNDPAICSGGTGVGLTANGSGGFTPYSYLWSTGETTQSIVANTAGIYWVDITDTTNCGAVRDSVTVIEYSSDITADAGGDVTVCSSSPAVTLAGVVTVADGGQWQLGTDAGFSLSRDSMSNTYTPSAAEILAGTVTLRLVSTGNHGCPGDTSYKVITINPQPTTSNAGTNQDLCGTTTTNLDGNSPSVGTGEWTLVSGTGSIASSSLPNSGVTGLTIGASSTFQWTITSVGCTPSTSDVVITTNEVPAATATPSSQSFCSGSATSISLSSTVLGTTYAWTVVQSGVSGASDGSGSSIAQTLTATGTSPGTATYTITPTANACDGTPITVVVTVNPIPIVTATPASQTICSGTAPGIILTSDVGGTVFDWTVVQLGVSGASDGSGSSIAQTLTATGITDGTATYTITPSANGCSGTPITVVITVNPVPVLTATPSSQSMCSGSATSISLTADVAGTTFGWTVVQSNVSGASNSSGSSIAQTLTATTSSSGTATYTITPTAGSCSGTTENVVVTVNPIPVATATPSSQSICSGTATSVALTSDASGTTFAWTVVQANVSGASDGSGTSIAQTLTATTSSPGTATYTITPSVGTCSGSSITATITVNPIPVATTTPSSQTICSGSATSIVLTSTVGGTTYSWTVVQSGVSGASASSGATIAQTLTATGTSSGTATYTITPSANSCNGSNKTVIVTVNPAPVATATPASQTLCSGSATSIALTSNVSGTTFAWTVVQSGVSGASAGSGSTIAQTITATGTSAGTATYTITPTAGGCDGTPITVVVTVNPIPVATATPSAQTLCSGNPTSVALTSDVAGTTFSWTVVQSGVSGASASSGATIAQTLTATGTSAGTATYTITPSANSCNGSSITATITVNPIPTAIATPSSQTICSGNATSVALTSNVSGATFSWTVVQSGVSGASANSGTTIAQTLNATGTSAGTATYTITPSANGCSGSSIIATVTVNPTPVLTATPASQTLCSGSATSIDLTSNVSGTTFAWTVVQSNVSGASNGSGSTIAQTLTATTTSAGTATYTVTPTANGCSGTAVIVVVTVNPIPVGTATPNSEVFCSGGTTGISLTSTVAGTTFDWTVTQSGTSGASAGSGTSIAQTLTATGTTNGTATYTITPTANGCSGSTITATITVKPIPVATATPSAQTLCSGNATSVALTSTVSGTTFAWTVVQSNVSGASAGSGSTIAQALTATTTSAGTATYTVTPTANGCVGSAITATITVNPTPVATATPSSQTLCSGNPTSIDLTSNVAGTTFSWTVVQSGVSGASANSGSTIAQTLTATGTSAGTATYTITPSANSCNGTAITATVTVNPIPVVTATPSSQTICSGNTTSVSLTSNVSGSTFAWTVVQSGVSGASDGSGSSIAQALTATGTSAGTATYTITPTANSCSGSSISVIITVNPIPVATATPNTQTFCSGGTTGIALTSDVAGTAFAWTVVQSNVSGASDGTGLTIAQTLTATSASAGTATYTITPTASSCSGSPITATITVNPIPVATTTPSSQTICSGAATSVSLTSDVSGTTFSWTVVQSNVSGASAGSGSTIAQTLTATTTSAGTATYTITPTANSCAGTNKTVIVTVNPIPIVTATPASETFCSGGTTSIVLTSTVSGTTFSRTVVQSGVTGASAGSGANINQTITTTGASTGTATYTVTPTASSCSGTAITVPITVNPIPVATTTPSSQTICSGNPTSVSLTSDVAGTTFSWTVSQSGVSGASAGSGISIAQTLTTTGTSSGSATYTITPDANSCSGTSVNANITVNPLPSAAGTITGTATLCQSTSGVSYSVVAITNATGYVWTLPTGASIVTGSNTNSITVDFSSSATSGNITVQGTNACGSGTVSPDFAVTVNATPAAPTVSGTTICNGFTATLDATAPGGTYDWYDAASGGNLLFTGASYTTPVLSSTTTYHVQSTISGCEGPRTAVTVTVNPTENSSFSYSAGTYCKTGPTNPTPTAVLPGGTYSATPGLEFVDVGTNTGSSTGQIHLVNSAPTPPITYTITYTTGGACFSSSSVNVSITENPDATFSYAGTPFCQAGANPVPTFPGGSSAGIFTSTAGLEFVDDATGEIDLAISIVGSYTITNTISAAGCTDDIKTFPIQIDTTAITAAGTDQSICAGTTATMNGSISGAATSATWSAQTGSFSNNALLNAIYTPLAGEATDTLVLTTNDPAGTCTAANDTMVVTIKPLPVATATPPSQEFCSGSTTGIVLSSSISGTTYSWTVVQSGVSGASAGSGSNIAQTLSTTGSSIGTATYTITPTASSCAGSPITVVITVNPIPNAVATPASQAICSGSAAPISLSGAVSGTTFSWTVTQSGVSGANSGTGTDISETLTATGTSPGLATYTITPSANSCTGSSIAATVTVNPIPVATATPSAQTICSGDASSISLTSTVSGSTFSWTVVQTNVSGASSASGASINQTLTATTTSAGTATYTITPSANSCSGSAITATVTVNPIPSAIATPASETFCSGGTTSIALTSDVSGATFSWTVNQSGVSGATDDGGLSITQSLTATGTSAGTATYTITPSANSCSGTPITATVTVNPIPVATATPSAQTICSGNVTSIALTSDVSGSTFAWTVVQTDISGASANSGSNIAQILTATTVNAGTATYTITPTANSCPGSAITATVTVNPRPVATATPNTQTICSGSSTSVDLTADVSGTSFSWTVSQAGVTGASAGSGATIAQALMATTTSAGTATYTITPSASSCSGTPITATITVNPTPVATATPSSQTICSGEASSVDLTSNVSGTTFDWTVSQTDASGASAGSGNSIAQTLNATTSNIGNVTYTVTPTANSCPGTAITATVTVNPIPVATATPSAQTICSGVVTSISLSSDVSGSSFSWTVVESGVSGASASSGNNIAQTLTATSSTAGTATYTITPSANSCTGSAITATITVNPTPNAIATPASQTVCSDIPATIALTSDVSGASFSWTVSESGTSGANSGSGNTINETLTATGNTAGTATYTITPSANSCDGSAITATITVNPTPVVTATPSSQTRCSGTATSIALTSNVSGSTFSWTVIQSGVSGASASSGTTISQILSTTAVAVGTATYSVTPSANGCPGSASSVVITVNPKATVDAGANDSICEGSSYTLSGSMGGSATGIIWTTTTGGSFNDATLLAATYTPSATDISAGSVKLTISTNDPDGAGPCNVATDTVRIFITNSITVDAGGNQAVCADNAVANMNGSISGGTTTGIWTTSGTGTFSSNTSLTATYTASPADTVAGTVTLTLTSTNNGGCNPASNSMILTITPKIEAGGASNATVCANNADVQLNGVISGGSNTGIWSTSGTGTFSPDATTLNAIYISSDDDTAAGSVILTLTSTNNVGCFAQTSIMTITINDAPLVFAGNDQSVCANNATANLSGNVSAGATTGQWSTSGTGIFSSDTLLNTVYTPSVPDTTAGIIYLVLTSTNNGNCLAVTDTMELVITNSPVADAGGNVTGCNDEAIVMNGNIIGGNGTGIWTSAGDGTFDTATLLNASYTPGNNDTINGSVVLTLTSTNNGNCNAASDDMILSFSPRPVVDGGSNVTVCGNNANVILNGSVSGSSTTGYWSTSGTGTFSPDSSALNATYSPSNADTALGSVTLTLTATNSCPVQKTLVVTITDAPFVNAGVNKIVCKNNLTAQLNGVVSGGATTGTWTTTGTGTFSPNANTLNATYNAVPADTSGTLVFVLASTNFGTCNEVTDTMLMSFTDPPVLFTGNDQTVCATSDVSLSGSLSQGTSTVQWISVGTGTFTDSSQLNTSYIFSAQDTTNATVKLILTATNSGCSVANDTMDVTIIPAPNANAGIDIAVCSNNNSITINGQVWATTTTGEWSSLGTGTFSSPVSSLSNIYLPSQDDIDAGTVSLVLTTTNNGICSAVTDTLVATITDGPVVDAGTDMIVCNDDIVTLSGTVSGGASQGGWTSSGTGTFTPDGNTLTATYIPGGADTIAGSIVLTLTSTDNGGCNAVQDSVEITFAQRPNISAGLDTSVCANNASVALSGSVQSDAGTGIWTTSGTGIFLPNDTDLSATYIPSDDDTTTQLVTLFLTATNACPITDFMQVSIIPAPVADAGNDQFICVDITTASLNGTVNGATTTGQWSTLGSGTFSPDDITLNATYLRSFTDSANGSVTLVLESTNNGICAASSDTMIIAWTTVPVVDAGNNITACANNDSILLNGSVSGGAATGQWSTLGNGTFSPSEDFLNTAYIFSAADIAAGLVKLILSSTQACVNVTDTLELTITPAPVVDAGNNVTVCANNADVSLNGSVSAGALTGQWTTSGSGTFSPNSTDFAVTYSPSNGDKSAGSVNIILTSTNNGLCNAVTDTMKITITPKPNVNAGANKTVCGMSNVSITGTVSGGATKGIWSTNGTGTFSPNDSSLSITYIPTSGDTASGTIKIFLTSTNHGNNNCLAVTDSMTVTFQEKPIVDAGTDEAVCANNNSVQLNGSVTGVTNTGLWTTSGSGTFSPDSITLNAVYLPDSADIANGAVTIRLRSTNNGSCTSVKDSIIITITPSPIVEAGNDVDVCTNNSDVLLNGSVTGGAISGIWTTSGDGIFTPNDSDLTAIYQPGDDDTTNGTVTLYLTSTNNGNCFEVMDSLIVTILDEPLVFAGINQTVCANTDLPLSGIFIGGTGSGQWTSTGSGTFVPDDISLIVTYIFSSSDTSAGTVDITLTADSVSGCLLASSAITITITDAPFVEAGNDTTVCGISSDVQLNGIVSGANTTGQWISSGTGTFIPDEFALSAVYSPSDDDKTTGTVTLTLNATNIGDCNPVSDSLVVTIMPPSFTDAGEDRLVCKGNNISLNGTVIGETTTGIWTTTGTGTFANSSNLTTTYFPSGGDTVSGMIQFVLTSTNNINCPAFSDTMFAIFLNKPEVNAGLDQTVCGDVVSVSLSGSVSGSTTTGIWSTTGAGIFTPGATTLTGNYLPDSADVANGSVKLILKSTNGCTVRDTAEITFVPVPVADAGEDQILCIDADTVHLIGSVSGETSTGIWTTSGNGTFTPGNTSLIVDYLISASDSSLGSFMLILISSNNSVCSPGTDTMLVTMTSVPIVNAGIDFSFCANNANIPLQGNISGGTTTGIWTTLGSGTFTPSDTLLNATYIPSDDDTANHSVKLVLTSTGACVNISDTVFYIITPASFVNAGVDDTVCANNSAVSLSGSVSGITTTGQWTSLGGGTFSPGNTDLNATYTPSASEISAGIAKIILVSTNNGNCFSVKDTAVITINPAPVVNAGPNAFVCNGNNIQLTGSVVSSSGTGQWSTIGTGTFTPDVFALNATYVPSAADTSTGIVIFALESTNNGICNSVTDAVTITLTPKPNVNAGTDVTVCSNNPQVVLNGSVSGSSTTGVWTTIGSGTFSDSVSLNSTYSPGLDDITAGTVSLILSSTNTCPVTDTVIVTINSAASVNAGFDQFFCSQNPVAQLNGTVSGPTTTGIWTTSGTGVFVPNDSALNAEYIPSAFDTSLGEITLTLTSTNNVLCLPNFDEMKIFFVPAPLVNAGQDQVVCANLGAVLNGIISGSSGSGVWTSSGSGTFIPDTTNLNATYNFSSGDIADGSVTLILFSDEFEGCESISDTLLVTITAAPTVNVGSSDTAACANNSIVILSGQVGGSTSTGMWSSSSGTGTFLPNDSSLNATYTPSEEDTAAGFVTIQLITTNNGACAAEQESFTVTLTPAPYVNAGGNQFVCNGDSIFINGEVSVATTTGIWTHNGSGTLSPDDVTMSIVYAPSTADTIAGAITFVLTSTNNGNCLAVTDTAVITLTPIPFVEAGNNQTVCANNADIALNGIVSGSSTTGIWTSTGTGTFSPDATTLNAIYLPSSNDTSAGNIQLILSSTNACLRQDSFPVIITPAPVVDAGPDETVCLGVQTVELGGNVSVATTTGEWSTLGTGTFSPNNTSMTPLYSISADDSTAMGVSIILSSTNNGLCNAVTDTMEIIITTVPTVDAGANQNVCANSNAQLSGAISGGASSGIWTSSGSGTFMPTDTSLNATYIFSVNDTLLDSLTITLTSTNACVDVADAMVITITPAPVAIATSDGACGNNSVVELTGEIMNASGGIWSSLGTGTFSPTDSTLDSLTYIMSADDLLDSALTLVLTSTGNGICNAETDTLLIALTPAPVVNAGPDQNICLTGIINAFLNGSISGGTTTGEWSSSGSGLFFPNSATLNCVYIPSVADTANGSVVITLVSTNNGGCSAVQDSVNITWTPIPVLTVFSADTAFCFDTAGVPLSGSVSGGTTTGIWTSSGNGIFVPSDTSLNATFIPDSTDEGTAVTVVLSSTNGCILVSDTMAIAVNAMPQADFSFTTQCNNLNVPFTDLSTIGSGAIASWNWNFGNTTSTLQSPVNTYDSASVYDVTLVINSDNGCSDTATQQVSFGSVNADFTFTENCLYDTVFFTDNSIASNDNIISWQWNFGNNDSDTMQNPLNNFGTAGNYSVNLTVQTASGCVDSISQTVTVHPQPTAGFTVTSDSLFAGTEISFTDNSTGANTWQWDFNDGGTSSLQNPAYTYLQEGTYNVTQVVTSGFGCADTFIVGITVNPVPPTEEEITFPPVVPAAFSPNEDGKNDLLYVRGGSEPFQSFSFTIFNEWGERIFISESRDIGWDGTKDGKKQPVGVYVYLLKIVDSKGETIELTGDVTLVR